MREPDIVGIAVRINRAAGEMGRCTEGAARCLEELHRADQDAMRVHQEFAGKLGAALGGLFEVEQEWPCVRRITKG